MIALVSLLLRLTDVFVLVLSRFQFSQWYSGPVQMQAIVRAGLWCSVSVTVRNDHHVGNALLTVVEGRPLIDHQPTVVTTAATVALAFTNTNFLLDISFWFSTAAAFTFSSQSSQCCCWLVLTINRSSSFSSSTFTSSTSNTSCHFLSACAQSKSGRIVTAAAF